MGTHNEHLEDEPRAATLNQAGRGLIGRTDPNTGEHVESWPDLTYESVRSVCHLTSGPLSIPAPMVYEMVGNWKAALHLLPQALEQTAGALQRSLKEYEVTDGPGLDPAAQAREASASMLEAGRLVRTAAQLLEEAQQTIARQGYVTKTGQYPAVPVRPR